MEGHNAGINWCAFHAVQQLIVSSADDKKIKLWKFTETRCWEAD
jgi:coatomer protein complex subunit alpha (xenin)